MTISEALAWANPNADLDELVDLDNAIESLVVAHSRRARVVDLRAFGGRTSEEAAETMGVSLSIVAGGGVDLKAVEVERPS